MNRYRMHKGRLPLGPLFLSGALAGILMMNFGKSIMLENTGLLDEYTLYHMKYMTVDSSALFYYVMRLRAESAITLVVLSTTYLGLAVCAGTVFWYGLSTGSFLATVMIRYGLRGILFAMAGILPQYLFYVPAFVALIVWCESLNRSIYFRSSMPAEGDKGILWPKRITQLIVIFCVLFIGCLLEGFVNPKVLTKILKIF